MIESIHSSTLPAADPRVSHARRILWGDFWRTMWRSVIFHLFYRAVGNGLFILLAALSARLIDGALSGMASGATLIWIAIILALASILEPLILFVRNVFILTDTYAHELAMLKRYLNMPLSRARCLNRGEIPERLMVDLVRYRLDTLDVVGVFPVFVTGLLATVVAGFWGAWPIIIAISTALLSLLVATIVGKRGAKAENTLRVHSIVQSAVLQEVVSAHEYYWARGRAKVGSERVSEKWQRFVSSRGKSTFNQWARHDYLSANLPGIGATVALLFGTVLSSIGSLSIGEVVGTAVLLPPIQSAVQAVIDLQSAVRRRALVSLRLGWIVAPNDSTAQLGSGEAIAQCLTPAEFRNSLVLESFQAVTPGCWLTTPMSVELVAGDILWVKGENGSGKTTLARTLACLATARKGKLLYCGVPALASSCYRPFYLPQVPSFVSGTVVENVVFDRNDLNQDAACRLEVFQLADPDFVISDSLGGPLSGGEARIVAWLRHIRHSGGVRILDEPLNGLSPDSADRVIREIVSSRNRWITILVSHGDEPRSIPGVLRRELAKPVP